MPVLMRGLRGLLMDCQCLWVNLPNKLAGLALMPTGSISSLEEGNDGREA